MSANKITLLLGIHCHQPVGNFEWVLEDGYKKAYLPFVEALERHPKIKMALHYSGSLLEWIEKSHPEFLNKIAQLVKRGQVEVMTGGFYEPILAIIPERDRMNVTQYDIQSDEEEEDETPLAQLSEPFASTPRTDKNRCIATWVEHIKIGIGTGPPDIGVGIPPGTQPGLRAGDNWTNGQFGFEVPGQVIQSDAYRYLFRVMAGLFGF